MVRRSQKSSALQSLSRQKAPISLILLTLLLRKARILLELVVWFGIRWHLALYEVDAVRDGDMWPLNYVISVSSQQLHEAFFKRAGTLSFF